MKKVYTVIIICISLFVNMMLSYADEMIFADIEKDDIEKIDIYVNINRVTNPKHQYTIKTSNKSEIEYIYHFITSLSLASKNHSRYEAHAPIVHILVANKDGKSKTVGFVNGDFFDTEEKEYSVPKEEYERFLEFAYALKTQALLITDTPTYDISDWAEDCVVKAKQTVLLPRWNQIDYKKDISRLEVCQLTDNLLRIKNQKISDIKEYPFYDTEDKAVKELYNIGVIKGKTETEFFPYHNITREEFIKILYQVYEYMTNNSELLESEFDFADKGEISDWAIECVKNMASLGIIKGYEDGRFDPKGPITKEQAVVMLQRLYDLMK